MELVSRALRTFGPEVMISDVSAELAQYALLNGVPPVVRRLSGSRTDDAHLNAYRDSTMIAYFPESAEYATTEYPFGDRTIYTGLPMPPELVAAVAGYTPPKVHQPKDGSRAKVIYLTSLGGEGVNLQDLNRVAEQTRDRFDWEIVGITNSRTGRKLDENTWEEDPSCQPAENVTLRGVVTDPNRYLADANIIVTSGGSDAVRDAATTLKPVVIVPEQRPFREQLRYAQGLQRATNANGSRGDLNRGVQVVTLQSDRDWNALLERALEQDPRNLVDAVFVSPDDFRDSLLDVISLARDRSVAPQHEKSTVEMNFDTARESDRRRELLDLMHEPDLTWDFSPSTL